MHSNTLEISSAGTATISCTQLDTMGNQQSLSMHVIDEHDFTVCLPDEAPLHFSCMPQNLRELIVGHLFSEGRIADLSELLECSFNADRSCAEVRLSSPRGTHVPLLPLQTPHVDLPAIFSAAQKLSLGFDSYKTTKSAHSCQLWAHEKLICVFEDLGRHNAIDKAIGHALLHGIDLKDCFLFTSCRLPSDIVNKVIRCRIPILASKSMPTRRSVEIAQQYGLKLICCAKPDSLLLFS